MLDEITGPDLDDAGMNPGRQICRCCPRRRRAIVLFMKAAPDRRQQRGKRNEP
jgi:hypothetical protein